MTQETISGGKFLTKTVINQAFDVIIPNALVIFNNTELLNGNNFGVISVRTRNLFLEPTVIGDVEASKRDLSRLKELTIMVNWGIQKTRETRETIQDILQYCPGNIQDGDDYSLVYTAIDKRSDIVVSVCGTETVMDGCIANQMLTLIQYFTMLARDNYLKNTRHKLENRI